MSDLFYQAIDDQTLCFVTFTLKDYECLLLRKWRECVFSRKDISVCWTYKHFIQSRDFKPISILTSSADQ